MSCSHLKKHAETTKVFVNVQRKGIARSKNKSPVTFFGLCHETIVFEQKKAAKRLIHTTINKRKKVARSFRAFC